MNSHPDGLPEYETARLLHRPLVEDDLVWLARLYADPRVMRYLGTGKTRVWGESAQALMGMRTSYTTHGFGLYATILKTIGRAIGRCGLIQWPPEAGGELEIAYALDPDQWGQGYATEAAALFAGVVWGLSPRDHVVSYIRPQNRASARVAQKVGMRLWTRRELRGAPADVYRLDRPRPA